MKTSVIYKITGPTGLEYYGWTVDFKRRKQEHLHAAYSGTLGVLYDDMRKLGKENFVFEEVVTGIVSKDWGSNLEQTFISWKNSIHPNGYNMTGGGVGIGILCDELLERKRESIRKSWEDPEIRKKRSEGITKAVQTPEFKEKQSESIRKSWEDPEIRKKRSEGITKAYENPEVKERHRIGCVLFQNDEKTKEKRRNTDARPEVKARRRESQRLAQLRPGRKELNREVQLIAQNRPEVRKRKKELHADPEYREMQRRGAYKGWETRRAREAAEKGRNPL